MPDDDRRPGRARRILKGVLFAGAKTPWERRNTGLGSSWSLAKSAWRRHRSICPECGQGKLILEQHDDDGNAHPATLTCQFCGVSQVIENSVQDVTSTIDDLRIGERRFLRASAGALVFGTLYYFTSGNIWTLIGLTFIAFFLFVNAMAYRYRVFKLVHQKHYPQRVPVRAWLAHEFSNDDADPPKRLRQTKPED